MALKLANNATGRLAVNITNSDTAIVLQPGDGATFPTIDPGDWFPITLLRADGTYEIAYVTAKSGDTLTVDRGKENTSPIGFIVNDRVEMRATAGIYASFFPRAGGAIDGDINVTGDIRTHRPDNPTTGAVYLGNGGTGWLHYDGVSSYSLGAAGTIWHSGNFNPASYLPLTGGSMTGGLRILEGPPFSGSGWRGCLRVDKGQGIQWLKGSNSYSLGLVGYSDTFYWVRTAADDTSAASTTLMYLDSAGNLVATANIGAYSDRKHKTDISTIESALRLVECMRGVRYTDRRSGARRVGVIAQEMQQVLPEVVGESDDGLYVDYGNITAALIEAVKELTKRVRDLEARP